jgi:hypothetical protein
VTAPKPCRVALNLTSKVQRESVLFTTVIAIDETPDATPASGEFISELIALVSLRSGAGIFETMIFENAIFWTKEESNEPEMLRFQSVAAGSNFG